MFLALALLTIQDVTVLAYLLDSGFFATHSTEEMRALLFFVGLFTLLLSIPSIIWNYSMMKSSSKPKDYIGFVLSIISLITGALIFFAWYVIGIHVVGGKVFGII